MAKQRWAVGARLAAALLLAIGAQHMLTSRRALVWDGIILYVLAMMLYASAVRASAASGRSERVAGASLPAELWSLLGRSPIRLALLVAAAGVVIYVSLAAARRPSERSFADLTALWLAALVCSVVVFVRLPRRRSASAALRRWWQPEPLAVTLLVVGATLLRAINLEHVPPVLSGDEASMGLEALAMIQGTRHNPFATGWLSHPTLYFALQSVFLRLGGASVASLRLSSALVSGAAGIWLYLLVRRHLGAGMALMALAYYAAYHYAIHYGRLGLNNIWDVFWALAGIWLVDITLDGNRPLPAVLAGLCAGLSLYFYLGARLVPVLMVLYALLRAWREQGLLRRRAAALCCAAVAALMAGLPLLLFYQRHPEQLTARWRWVGIFPSGWVASEVARTGKSIAAVLAGQFWKAALAFTATKDPTFWYRPDRPLLFFASAVFFAFGLTHCVLQRRKPFCALVLAWFALVILFGGVLLENPPSSPRLVMAIPPVVTMVVLGMREVAALAAMVWRRSVAVGWVASWVLVLATAVSSLHFYFGVYTPQRMFSDHNTATADAIGRFLQTRGPGLTWYLLGAPRLYVGHATIPYLAQQARGIDVVEPLAGAADVPRSGQLFVVLPEREGELVAIQQRYPGGLLSQHDDDKGRPLFYVYELQPR